VAPSGECLQGEGLVWLIEGGGVFASCCHGSSCPLARAMDGRNLRCSTIGSRTNGAAMHKQLPIPRL